MTLYEALIWITLIIRVETYLRPKIHAFLTLVKNRLGQPTDSTEQIRGIDRYSSYIELNSVQVLAEYKLI